MPKSVQNPGIPCQYFEKVVHSVSATEGGGKFVGVCDEPADPNGGVLYHREGILVFACEDHKNAIRSMNRANSARARLAAKNSTGREI